MRTRGSRIRSGVALLAAVSILAAPGGALAALMQVRTAGAATTPSVPDGEWPRRYLAPDGALVVLYEPQIASWENQKLLTLHAATSYAPSGSDQPLLGTFIAEADTRVSVAERLVDFSSFRITQSNFPNASREQAAAAVAAVKASMPLDDRVFSLDKVLAYQDASRIRPRNVDGVKADPPVVFFSTRPAVVVNLDGNPIWSPIQGSDLRFAVNTNWDLFEHGPSNTFIYGTKTSG